MNDSNRQMFTLIAPENEFEEFSAEVNDNVLIVRVTKANRKVTRVCDEQESCVNENPCKYHLKNLNMICSDDGDNVGLLNNIKMFPN